ncbi:MAG: DPP IV N-terminal domain-containing protein [Gammaproteobacteria bacterium]
MNINRLLVMACAVAGLVLASNVDAAASVTPQPSFTQPSMSPDGSRIAFVADGAIWEVPATGGVAQLLVSDSAPDSRPLFSPDGRHLAFVSDKAGHGDIYLLNLTDGSLKRLTWSDVPDVPSGFSADGEWLYFTSGRNNIAHFGAVYRVRVSGGTPMPVSQELYRNEEAGVPSPDGKLVALVGQGWGSTQWWRHGRAHIDDGAIWLLDNNGSHDYRRLTPDNARALWPMWNPDGRSVYYMSDRSGTDNIWSVRLDGKEHAVTHFTDGRCLWPTLAADGGTIAFQRNFHIWTLDTHTGKTRQVPIRLGGAVAGPGTTERHFTSHFSDLALSPDGKKLVFVVHGDIFAAPAGKPGPAHQITHTAAAEFSVRWAPDSRRIIYVSNRDGTDHLFIYNFATGKERRLTDTQGNDLTPQFSPDGRWVAFIRNGKQLDVVNTKSGKTRELASGELDLHHPLESTRPFAWSPDSRWVAFLAWGPRMYRNAEVVPVDGGKARTVSFMGNTFADSLWWSPGGKALFFSSGQRTEPGQIARVDLVQKAPQFREQQFLDLFKESSAPGEAHGSAGRGGEASGAGQGMKPKPAHVSIDFHHIARRLHILPVGLNAGAIAVSPDGKTLLFSAEVGGHENLYTWSLAPLVLKPPVTHQITSTPGPKSSAQFSPDGKTVWYLDDGKIYSVPVKGGSPKPFATSATMEVNFQAEKEVAFHEAWRWLDVNFHNPDMNGVNWKAVKARYAPLVAGAETKATLQRILNRMVGELDSSHSGVRWHRKAPDVIGRIGLRFDPAVYEQQGRFRISQVIPQSPAALAGHIAEGDYLLAVDGTQLGADTNLDALLENRIGKETVLTVADNAGGRHTREVKVKPVNAGAAEQLVYESWVEHNREMVAKLSDGRLGYIDLPDMSMRSLQRLYRAIDARNGDKQGVVIDVRNNFGGFVNAYALDALVRKHYLNMTFRGMKRVSARPLLGQRALERPTVLITNRVTLSDGEDFTEGYRELGLGKIVGEPTAGWIVYTSDVPLINGFVVRLPFITVTTADGKPMEMHPRPVDVQVAEPLGESYHGEDARLKAAVEVLLKQIGSRPAK